MRQSIELLLNRPPYQAAMILIAEILIMTVAFLLDRAGILTQDRLFPWSVATALTLFFAIMNSLICLRVQHFAVYWRDAMYSYLALIFLSVGAAWLFSGVQLNDAGTYKWIFLVITFGFLVFLSMINLMKKIVQYAEREEWDQPRKRRK